MHSILLALLVALLVALIVELLAGLLVALLVELLVLLDNRLAYSRFVAKPCVLVAAVYESF